MSAGAGISGRGDLSTLAVGHDPAPGLAPQDARLFRSFQSNLLSLISHELRTPLTGILNALGLLDEQERERDGRAGQGEESSVPGFTRPELIRMARQNAERLSRTLVTLLDLAQLESGTFHARLKELDLARLVKKRLQLHRALFHDRELRLDAAEVRETRVLGDPGKLSRAIDLCLQVAAFRARRGSRLRVIVASEPDRRLEIGFEVEPETRRLWEEAWTHGLAGFESGVGSPSSPFAGVLQSEQAFLSRTEEGLGGELLLIHEILSRHDGKFTQERRELQVLLKLGFPDFTSESAIRMVLSSRAYQVSTEPGAVALLLLRVPEGWKLEELTPRVRRLLYRTSDGAYPLPDQGALAVILDDYRKEDLPRLLERLERSLGVRLEAGMAQSPDDDTDPSRLLEIASRTVSRGPSY